MNRLIARGVSHTFPGSEGSEPLEVLGGVDLTVAPGEIACVVGSSGSGKTTLLNLMSGLLRPTEGRILVEEKSVDGPSGYAGYLLQKNVLLPWFNLRDNVALPLALRGISRAERADRADEGLARVGLSGFNAYFPAQLSGGMQKRACLARVLLEDHRVLLLDEPFAGLDYDLRLRLEQEVADYVRTRDTAAVIVTHDIESAVALADRIVVLVRAARGARVGAVVETGSLAVLGPVDARLQEDFGACFRTTLDAYRAGGDCG